MKYLVSVDLSNYNPDFIMNFTKMFYGCSSLKSINFGRYFNGLIMENMESMFENCVSLLSVNLSGVYAGVLANMKSTFAGCGSLISVNLSNFRISEIKNVEFLINDFTRRVYKEAKEKEKTHGNNRKENKNVRCIGNAA